jgi:hypothetical protein
MNKMTIVVDYVGEFALAAVQQRKVFLPIITH